VNAAELGKQADQAARPADGLARDTAAVAGGGQRPVTDFSTLDVTGPGGFAVTGAGAADVVTPPAFRPGSRHRVRIQAAESARDEEATAGDQAELHLRVPLGGGPARAAVTIGGG
jgi:hypothetical protein